MSRLMFFEIVLAGMFYMYALHGAYGGLILVENCWKDIINSHVVKMQWESHCDMPCLFSPNKPKLGP